MYWQLGLPVPPGSLAVGGNRLPVAELTKFTGEGPQGATVGDVEEGVAPEWGWWHSSSVSRCGKSGDQSRRTTHLYGIAGAKPTEVEASFSEMRAGTFVGEVVPGWATAMLGYAPRRADGSWGPVGSPGPLFSVRLGQHLVVRVHNEIPAELNLPISVHLHGGHTPAHSDGHPNFLIEPGEARDYYYPNGIPLRTTWNGEKWVAEEGNWDTSEVPTTLWYHDHAIDITAHNALMGLAGLYLLHDEVEDGLRQAGTLPPTERDLPLALRDVCLLPVRDKAQQSPEIQGKPGVEGEARIHFDPFDHDGSLGDFVLVNGVFAPHVALAPDTWRFRILNASLARFYNLRFVAVKKGARVEERISQLMEGERGGMGTSPPTDPISSEDVSAPLRFARIGRDTWMFDHAIEQDTAFLSMAGRADFVIDLRQSPGQAFPTGSYDIYLVSTLSQRDGRGPGHGDNANDTVDGDVPRGQKGEPPQEAAPANWLWLMKIELQGPTGSGSPLATGPSSPVLRPHEPLVEKLRHLGVTFQGTPTPGAPVIPTREFIFERGRGAWQINGRFYDAGIANAVPALFGVERWILKNKSGGWWHPIHIHLESHQQVYALARGINNERAEICHPDYAAMAGLGGSPSYPWADASTWSTAIKYDTTILGPNTEVHLLMQFRTFEGPFVFHCHNLNHEDMMMMFQFDPRLTGTAYDQSVRREYFFLCNEHEECCLLGSGACSPTCPAPPKP